MQKTRTSMARCPTFLEYSSGTDVWVTWHLYGRQAWDVASRYRVCTVKTVPLTRLDHPKCSTVSKTSGTRTKPTGKCSCTDYRCVTLQGIPWIQVFPVYHGILKKTSITNNCLYITIHFELCSNIWTFFLTFSALFSEIQTKKRSKRT